jgi:hypothetical protein
MNRVFICFLGLLAFVIQAGGRGPLTDDELKMLQDPGGWQYVTISDTDSGVQTQHTCFDGKPHPQECSGTLTLTAGNTFVSSIHIHGQTVDRHGTYELDGKQLTLFDEFGTQDGPYALDINTHTKHLVLKLPPLRMELELESQYRQDMRSAQQQHQ